MLDFVLLMFASSSAFSNVKYENALGRFQDEHTIVGKKKNGTEFTITGDNIVIAVGGRPHYPEIPGAIEHCVTSDDIFSMPEPPGKTLIIGSGCILEFLLSNFFCTEGKNT